VPSAGGPPRVIYPALGAEFPKAAHVVPEIVTTRAADGLEISNQLFLPKDLKPGERRPAIVFVHGGPSRQMLPAYHYMQFYHWSYAFNQWLQTQGYVVLSVNFRLGIGYGNSFRRAPGTRTQGNAEYQDVLAGAKYLQGRPDVRADRVGLLGWSNGAAATLSVLFDRGTAVQDFRAAVAFYPSCTRTYPGGKDPRPYAPLYLLIGALDDWTPAAPCVALVERARAAGAPLAIKVYPGAHHSFDAPATPVRYRPEVRNHNKPQGCCGATVGTDPAARADAIAEVTRFFAAELGGSRQ